MLANRLIGSGSKNCLPDSSTFYVLYLLIPFYWELGLGSDLNFSQAYDCSPSYYDIKQKNEKTGLDEDGENKKNRVKLIFMQKKAIC